MVKMAYMYVQIFKMLRNGGVLRHVGYIYIQVCFCNLLKLEINWAQQRQF